MAFADDWYALPLTESQAARLAAWRAWWDEGEERYAHWERRDRDQEIIASFRALLERRGFARGADLTVAELDRLCALARALAPNRNLDRRLYTGPGEPEAFSRQLRALLYADAPLPERMAPLLARRGLGIQGVSQLLCAAYPDRFPLAAPAALAALQLTREQRSQLREATREAGVEPAQRLLGDLVALQAAHAALGATSHLETYRILTVASLHAPAALPLDTAGVVREAAADYGAPPVTEQDLLHALEASAAAAGLTYPSLLLRNYYVALKTRPFVVLSGISGTGKTRLTHLFAQTLTGNAPRQYRVVAVRPDWTDPTPLLGYWNVLAGPEGRYVSTRFLEFLREAGRPENAGRAYFVCLDEMNLARVEHYFADYLSAMETPDREIALHNELSVRIPTNLFISGTVNIDETTHAFSRKVLDRALTVELAEIDMASEPAQSAGSIALHDPAHLQSLFLSSRLPDVSAARQRLNALDGRYLPAALETLGTLNTALGDSGMPFGYRVRDEVLLYLAHSFDAAGQGLLASEPAANFRLALDLAILQKVLPRLTGTQEQIEPAIRALLAQWLPGGEAALPAPGAAPGLLQRLAAQSDFPHAAGKLAHLQARLLRDSYGSFYDV